MADDGIPNDNPYAAPGRGGAQPSRRRAWFGWLAAAVVGGLILLALVAPMTRRGDPDTARRVGCQLNLTAIAQALLAYEQEHGSLPPAFTRDAEGRPLYSWRTLLLPYLAENRLFESIDLTKPWDDPANAAAREQMPQLFACPSAGLPPGYTTYLVVVSPEGCFRAGGAVELAEVREPSKTLLLEEFPTARAVSWMAPVDADEAMPGGMSSTQAVAEERQAEQEREGPRGEMGGEGPAVGSEKRVGPAEEKVAREIGRQLPRVVADDRREHHAGEQSEKRFQHRLRIGEDAGPHAG